MGFFDTLLTAIAPERAVKRVAAQTAIRAINSGYSNYGASLHKKSMRGWMWHGGSPKEDIEDNLRVLRERSRDAYMGVPLATGAIKTMRTNVVCGGLTPTPQIDNAFLGISDEEAQKINEQIAREFALWANKPTCDADRIDNFYMLQQLAFTGFLLNGDSYTDSGSDSSDSLSIKVNAMDHKWIDSWMPDKEAVLHPTLCTTNWIVQGDRTVLDCGTLVVDDLSFSACPDVLTIGAVARPNGTSFHEKNREQVWKNTSIKRIAETIAGRYGLECKMDAEDVSVALKEQDDNDSSFLQKICSTYGLILKTYRNKIWIFDREKYKKKDSVATVKPIDIVPGSLSWNTTLAGTYTGGEFTYSNQKKKVNIKVTIGTADRMLKLNQYASSEADAKRQLQAAIDNKNHSATTISFTTMGNLTYCATQCIDVEGYGKIDGKYYMDSVGHTMNKSGGFVTKVSASRVGG